MKTELDFTRVPLDKWVDVFNTASECDELPYPLVKSLNDVQKLAQIQVKDESDLNKEIADSYEEWSTSPDKEKSSAAFNRMHDAIAEKRKLLSAIKQDIPF